MLLFSKILKNLENFRTSPMITRRECFRIHSLRSLTITKGVEFIQEPSFGIRHFPECEGFPKIYSGMFRQYAINCPLNMPIESYHLETDFVKGLV